MCGTMSLPGLPFGIVTSANLVPGGDHRSLIKISKTKGRWLLFFGRCRYLSIKRHYEYPLRIGTLLTLLKAS